MHEFILHDLTGLSTLISQRDYYFRICNNVKCQPVGTHNNTLCVTCTLTRVSEHVKQNHE
jgi:hypothetical protein